MALAERGLKRRIYSLASIGFDAVSYTAHDAQDPQRDLPIDYASPVDLYGPLYIVLLGVLTTGMVPWAKSREASRCPRVRRPGAGASSNISQ